MDLWLGKVGARIILFIDRLAGVKLIRDEHLLAITNKNFLCFHCWNFCDWNLYFLSRISKEAQLANICAYGSVRYNMSNYNYLIDSVLTSGAIIVCIQCNFSVEILSMYNHEATVLQHFSLFANAFNSHRTRWTTNW